LGQELEMLDRMISNSEARFDRALETLSKSQASVADRAREMSQRLIDAEKTSDVDDLEAAQ
jgi:hypothetical protein